MRCKTCHYSLEGHEGHGGLTAPPHRCPECGAAFDPANATTFETRRPFWRMSPFARWVLRITYWLMAAGGLVAYFKLLEQRWTTFAACIGLAVGLAVLVVTFVSSYRSWLEEE